MPKRKHGVSVHAKKYLWIKARPCRDQLVHRLIAAALIGRDLDKDMEVHHLDGNRQNPHWSNLLILGHTDHGWVSARQAYYMREKDRKEKILWDQFMAEKDAEFKAEVAEARGNCISWQPTRPDGTLQGQWEVRIGTGV